MRNELSMTQPIFQRNEFKKTKEYMHIHTHIVQNCVITLITCLSCNKLLHVYSYIHGENVFLQSSQEILHWHEIFHL